MLKDIQNIQEMIRGESMRLSRKSTIVALIKKDSCSFFKLDDVTDLIWNGYVGNIYTKNSDKHYTIEREDSFSTLLQNWIIFQKGHSPPYVELHDY